MKKITLFALVAVLFACKTDKNKQEAIQEDVSVVSIDVASNYPEVVTNIFDAHGGLSAWNSFRTLSFTMPTILTNFDFTRASKFDGFNLMFFCPQIHHTPEPNCELE